MNHSKLSRIIAVLVALILVFSAGNGLGGTLFDVFAVDETTNETIADEATPEEAPASQESSPESAEESTEESVEESVEEPAKEPVEEPAEEQEPVEESAEEAVTDENATATDENATEEPKDPFADVLVGDWITNPELLALIDQAFNKDSVMVDISEDVRTRIADKMISVCKEEKGFRLYNNENGACVDAETGLDYRMTDDFIQPEELERDADSEAAAREAGIRAGSNEELIARQQIVNPPEIKDGDFRFWTVARLYAFAKQELPIYEEASESGKKVGILPEKGMLSVIKELDNGWLFVETDGVRGFARAKNLIIGDEADKLLKQYKKEARKIARETKTKYTGPKMAAPAVKELVPASENAAFAYTRATAEETIAPKHYALANEEGVNVREGSSTDTRIVGTLPKKALCRIIADEDKEWIFVESGDVRGFVKSEYLDKGKSVDLIVSNEGEDKYPEARLKIDAKNNKALYYSIKSIKSGQPGGEIREAILEYAAQFVGNPYVWGGNDPVNGTDCSGLALHVYSKFGMSLPRISEMQSQVGMKIPVTAAAPGDLIFYAEAGHVYHVVIYAGEGTTIEAANESVGIIRGAVNYGAAVWATRLIDDEIDKTAEEESEITVEKTEDKEEAEGEKAEDKKDDAKSLGEFSISYFCSCDSCHGGIYDPKSDICGTRLIQGDTVVTDPEIIKPGTKIVIDGKEYTATDIGNEIKGNYIGVYVHDHEQTMAHDRHDSEVYLG